MNRERRKILASIFADTAKYGLTVGIVGAIIGENIFSPAMLIVGVIVTICFFLGLFCDPERQGGITMVYNLIALFAPILIAGTVFAIIFAIQDRKQTHRR
jgi:hypothetical protein